MCPVRLVLTSRSFLVALAILVTVLSRFPASVFAESEPNDTMEQADLIQIGLANAETGATLSSATDVDYYKFTAEAGRTYVIETFNIQAASQNRATILYLFDMSETQLAYDYYAENGTGNASARIVYTFTTSGTYFIRVTSYSSWTGTYSLRVLPKYDEPGAAWDSANDAEPNDELVLANEIEVGFSNAQSHRLFVHTNYATTGPDQDYYRFDAVAGRTYVIETFNIQATSNDSATGLYLFDASGTQLAEDADGDKGTGNTNARIVYTFTTSGTYFVLVKHDYYVSWTGTYSLRVLPKYDEPGAAWDSANDAEPNDELVLANRLEVGLNHSETHQLFPHTNFATRHPDRDYYRFDAVAGRTYVIETFNIQATSSRRATALYLFDASGTQLAEDADGDRGTGNANGRIIYTFTTSGTYFVLVQPYYYVPWTGTYSIRILPKYDEPGAAWDSANDAEPNDELVLANKLELGSIAAQTHQLFPHAGYATRHSDRDFYRFTAEAGRPYIIETFNVQGRRYTTDLYLYNSTGTLLADDHTLNNDIPEAVNARITYTFSQAGTYFVGVQSDPYREYTGAYSIRACREVCEAVQPPMPNAVYMPLVRRR